MRFRSTFAHPPYNDFSSTGSRELLGDGALDNEINRSVMTAVPLNGSSMFVCAAQSDLATYQPEYCNDCMATLT